MARDHQVIAEMSALLDQANDTSHLVLIVPKTDAVTELTYLSRVTKPLTDALGEMIQEISLEETGQELSDDHDSDAASVQVLVPQTQTQTQTQTTRDFLGE